VKSSFYKWRNLSESPKTDANQELKFHIQEINLKYPIYGYRRMTVEIRKKGFCVNHKRVYRLMSQLGMRSIIRKKRKTFGRKGSSVFSNVLERDFSCEQANHKLATDITYVPVTTGFIYLSAVQDLHNNEIVSYKIGKRNDLNLVLETVNQLKGSFKKRTILHSDQGFQYTSNYYRQAIEKIGIQGSHSRKGNCLDNACIESFFSHLKTEAFPTKELFDEQEAISNIKEYITFYNTKRFQKRLGQLSPIEFLEKLAA
jgi:transposase InsO family protein